MSYTFVLKSIIILSNGYCEVFMLKLLCMKQLVNKKTYFKLSNKKFYNKQKL